MNADYIIDIAARLHFIEPPPSVHYSHDLRCATYLLVDEVLALKMEINNASHAISCCCSRRQRVGLESLLAKWQRDLNTAMRFIDKRVLIDQEPS